MATAPEEVRFLCDAMLGGVARWLRAVGYDAAFEPNIEDGALVALGMQEALIVLSSDAPLFERRLLKSGRVRGLFVTRHAPVPEQVAFVLRHFELTVRDPRCMACGG